ncbi:hypothetical protein BDQ17DRAFT_1223012, partial [Cyathus striatus]
SAAFKIYLKIAIGGTSAVIIIIFAIFSIYWGSLWKTPAHSLPGWIVNFDGGAIGQAVTDALTAQSASSHIAWKMVDASAYPGGWEQLGSAVKDEHTWVAIAINSGASQRLQDSLSSPNASYSGVDAITVLAVEARNENAFRTIIRPTVQTTLEAISKSFAASNAQQLSQVNLTAVLATSPQTITTPISYSIVNLAPFDIPVASAITFVGLLYQLILSFFIVMICNAARLASGYPKHLTVAQLIRLRFASTVSAYFIISLFYSLLSLAFQVNFSRTFGPGGFVLFWTLNFAGMLASGLALESMLTILGPSLISFFMILLVISNVSACVFPLEVLPKIYHYGYAAPFYNVSRAARCLLFGTKNDVGKNFGILLVWITISCITLPLFQWFMSRREARA